MTELERQRAIRRQLTRLENRPPAAIPTGFAALDAALGVGGWPRGRIVELSGPPGCGKTSFALRTAAHARQNGLTAAWIDADCAFDPNWAASLGADGLVVARPASAEEGLAIAGRLAASFAVDLLVIDSAAALAPRLELEAGIGVSAPGLQSRVLASGLRRLSAAVARAGCVALFINQARGRPDVSGACAETTAGGPPLKLFAAVRIALESTPGGRLRFRIVKNKVAEAFAEGCL